MQILRTLILSAAGLIAVTGSLCADEKRDHFERVIRPILADACFKCHSVNAKKVKGGLLMDHIGTLKSGGDSGPSLVAGDPDNSLIIEAIRYENVDLEMPPSGKLPEDQVTALEQWVRDGAYWPDEPLPEATNLEIFDWKKRKTEHWCWQPIQNPEPPATDTQLRDPLDAFIHAKLKSKGLTPNPETDRRTWLRRVTFDLTGFPPSRDEIKSFLADRSDSAYETVVDRLLDSPHFGERWGRHWLDLVRYAESSGHEFDYSINHAYKYRDYVIRAFNANVPYDDLLREHIAGDLIEAPRLHPEKETNESILGTGFWFLHEAVHAPTNVKQDEADRIDNQIDVFSKSFLGLTVACSRCHDHKFDAIPTKDYYALSGYLQSSRRDEALLDSKGRINAAVTTLRDLRAKELAENQRPDPASIKATQNLILVAQDIVDGTITAPPPAPTKTSEPDLLSDAPDIVFDDFEDGYKKWTLTGTAFGKRPAKGSFGHQKVSGHLGQHLVNTFFKTSDKPTGTATSIPFTIERDYINFLCGGGYHKDKTCVDLVIDGKVVHSAIGQAREHGDKLLPVSWDVKAYKGKKANIVIKDEVKGSWGHIDVDHFVFSNRNAAPSVVPDPHVLTIAHVSKTRGLNKTQLETWVALLRDKAPNAPTHPLHAWRKLHSVRNINKTRGALIDQLTPKTPEGAEVLADFSRGDLDDVYLSGPAFGDEAVNGIASSRALSTKLHGVLRSKTFVLDTNHPVRFNVRGHNASIDLIIDGYYMRKFNGLLFGGTHHGIKDQHEWRQLSFNPSMYDGHRAWLEFTDYGDGYIEVADIVTGPAKQAPADPVTTEVLAHSFDSREALALELATALAKHPASAKRIGLPVAPSDMARQIAKLEKTIPAPEHAISITDGEPEDEHIFIRGNADSLGEVAPRQMPVAIFGENQPPPTSGSGRLELANSLTRPDNPLTARVMVNRVWHHLFGRGIVPTVDDFGVMGLPPTHPELLDHLATDFQSNEGDWDIKRLIRRLVLSGTYRMSSRPNPKAEAVDPTNELFHRMPIRRLQAEAIRDSLLAISGRLDPKAFGPSIPINLTPFQNGRGRPGSGPTDGNGRRSIYLSVRRNFLDTFLWTFDFPTPFSTMGKRTVSNVPAQSLVLMNNPFVLDMAKRWANNIHKLDATPREKLLHLYEDAIARPPTDSQLNKLAAYLEAEGDTLQTWQDLAHIVINLKEFIYLN